MEIGAGQLQQTIIELHGARGATWWRELPDLLERCARRWALKILPPFDNLSYNYVAPAVRADGSEAVLKVGVPHPELLSEMEALGHYDGRGSVRLLAADKAWGALLLERLRPGAMLVTVEDDEDATRVAAGVMRQLWRPPPEEHAFRSVADWAEGLQRLRDEFDGGTGPFPPSLVSLAEELFADLLASMDAPVVLHGDLHHYNILAAERRPWLAIDPKGITGEPAYEVGALLRNPLPQVAGWASLERLLSRRVAVLAEMLGFERRRLLAWGAAQAVLSAWWSYEDHGSPNGKAKGKGSSGGGAQGKGSFQAPALTCAGCLANLLA